MKKILAVSLVAMMSVTAANAQIASKAYVDVSADGNVVLRANTAGQNIAALDAAIGDLPEGKTAAEAIADAITTAGSNQVQANWTETTTTSKAYIQNKPTLGALAAKDEVAKSDLASALVTEIEGKADSSDLGDLAALDEVAESNLASALATKINGKADAATTLAGYGITDGVQSNAAITGATKTKITYDSKGLVTAGADLEASDIPTLTLSKISDAGTMAAEDADDYYDKADIGTITDGKTLVEMIEDASDVDNFISQSITDGVDDKAPSEDAVHDALALKADSSDLGDLAALDEVAESNLASALATKINGKADAATTLAGYGITDGVQSNAAITGATKTKITYDSKGLVTAGADLEASDIPTLTLSKISDAGTAAAQNVATGISENGAGLATSAQVYTAVQGATTAASDALGALDMVAADTTGNGNVVTSVNQVDGKVTAVKNITAIPQPSGECTDCVLHFNGTTYSWEEIARASGE